LFRFQLGLLLGQLVLLSLDFGMEGLKLLIALCKLTVRRLIGVAEIFCFFESL